MLYDPTARFSNSKKASSRRPKPGGLYIGKVVRVSASGVFVQIPRVAPTVTFGPCVVFTTYPVLGQRVLCGFLDNRFDEVVILGRETKSKIIKDVDAPSTPTDAANKLYVDSEILTLKEYVDSNFD